MRLRLALLLTCLPGAAAAVEDRYGPARTIDPIAQTRAPVTAAPMTASVAPPATAAVVYGGPMLSWSGRPSAGRLSAPVQAPAPVAYVARSPAPVAPPPSRLPTSLYDTPAPPPAYVPAPAPVPQAIAAPQPAPQAAPPQPAPPQPTPTPRAVATAPPAPVLPPPPSAPANTYGYGAARSYSVVREWGGTPDRIQAPPAQSQFAGRAEITLQPGLLGEEAAPEKDDPAGDADIPALTDAQAAKMQAARDKAAKAK